MIIIDRNEIHCKAILLDFDGTLVDSEPMLVRLWIDICESKKLQVEPKLIAELVRGRPATKIIDDLFQNFNGHDKSLILKQLESMEEVAQYKLMQGALDFIIQARNNGLLLGIVTTSWREKVENVLASYSIKELFSVIITREDVINLKPNPDPYFLAEKSIKIAREELITIEDSSSGVLSSKAAGIRCVGFGNVSLLEYGADFIVSAFNLIKLVK